MGLEIWQQREVALLTCHQIYGHGAMGWKLNTSALEDWVRIQKDLDRLETQMLENRINSRQTYVREEKLNV